VKARALRWSAYVITRVLVPTHQMPEVASTNDARSLSNDVIGVNEAKSQHV
jgi:hypothetical protein